MSTAETARSTAGASSKFAHAQSVQLDESKNRGGKNLASKDGRRNAFVKEQKWEPLEMVDTASLDTYLKMVTLGRYSAYLFSGSSPFGTLRVDFKAHPNVNLQADVLHLIDQLQPNSLDVVIADPLFDVLYNPSEAVWEKAIRDGRIPESVRTSKYFARPHAWQHRCLELVKPGGLFITKRNIPHTAGLTDNPQMFYIHDARPMAFIVRIDHK